MTAPEPDPAPGRKPDLPDPLAHYSSRHLAFFDLVFTRFAHRHMRALRLARWGEPEAPPDRPVVVFANHPSWWDGVAFMLLPRRLFPERRIFIPMEAEALARYGFMRRIGVFGVETRMARGGLAFLKTAQGVLGAPGTMLWMNAPGRFADVRERPVPIAPGLVRLPELAAEAVFLPLALEYPFWSERKPEMLAAFGSPLHAADLRAMPRPERTTALAAALESAMDRLAADAISRDPGRFRVVEQGAEGMGGIYDLWRRGRALLSGRRFDPRHETRP